MARAVPETKDWERVIPPRSKSDTMDPDFKGLALLSLMKYIDFPTGQFIRWLFGSAHPTARHRAAQYLSGNSGVSPLPWLLQTIWSDFPRAQPAMEDAIDPVVRDVLEREPRAVIRCRQLSIRPSDVKMDALLAKLGPGPNGIGTLVPVLMPRTFGWLLHAVSADNTYRSRLRRAGKLGATPEADPDVIEDGSLEFDEEDEGDAFPRSGADWHGQFPHFTRNPRLAVIFSLCTMAHVRNRATNALPLCLATQMTTHGANTRVCETFSQMGAVVSRRTMERFRIYLSDDAIARGSAAARADKRWEGLLDNLDLHITKFNQRVTNRNEMLHITNFAIRLSHSSVPESSVNLADHDRMRGGRSSARPKDITPTPSDNSHMIRASEYLVQKMLIEHAPSSAEWTNRQVLLAAAKAAMPAINPLTPEVTQTFPMGVLNTEEASVKGIIRALELMRARLGMSKEEWGADLHIMGGDFLTVRNMCTAQYLRSDDFDAVDRLETVKPQAQLFHFALNASHMLLQHHLGDEVRDHGSLSKHKNILQRTFSLSTMDYAQTRALIRHSLIGRILACAAEILGLRTWNKLKTWYPSPSELKTVAAKIVRTYATSKAAAKAQAAGDNVFAHNIMFMVDAIRFFEFDSAVSEGDAERVLIVLKYWAFDFRGAGKHNYARECAEVLLHWKYEMNAQQRQLWASSWFINRWGLPGRFIASDLYVEQLNYFVKVVHLSDGSGQNVDNIIKKGSACVEALQDLSRSVLQFVGAGERWQRHTESKVEHDLEVVFKFSIGTLTRLKATPARFLPAPPPKRTKKTGPPPVETEIESLRNKGVEAWMGKFMEFIDVTTYDRQLRSAHSQALSELSEEGPGLSAHDLGLSAQDGDTGGTGGADFDMEPE